MKKNLLLVLVFISTFGFSQQVLKKITNTSTHTIVELFILANGNTCSNTVGNYYFDLGPSSSASTVTYYPSNASSVWEAFSSYNSSLSYTTLPEEIVGNGSFSFIYSFNITYTDYTNNVGQTLNISTTASESEADALQDNNTLLDLFKSKIELPKFLNDNTPVPLNTWAVINSRYAVGVPFDVQEKVLIYQFNGNYWEFKPMFWDGIHTSDILQDACNSLSISENENSNNNILIYPTPTNNFITIQNFKSPKENFKYKILDLTGRIIKNGNSKFNEEINIENLTSGNYIIQIETEKGEKLTDKLIKK